VLLCSTNFHLHGTSVFQCAVSSVTPTLLRRRSTGDSYQNMESTGVYQAGAGQPPPKDFWETFGSNTSLKPKKSPSSDSWTVADNSAKKSSDSWDNWGSEAAAEAAEAAEAAAVSSNNKHSTGDSWEAWDNNWEKAADGKAKKSPSKPAEESWENADW